MKFTLKEERLDEVGEMRPAVAQCVIPVQHNPCRIPTRILTGWAACTGLDWDGNRDTASPSGCSTATRPSTVHWHHKVNYKGTLAAAWPAQWSFKLGGFDIVPVATFPIVLSCICVRRRRDGRRLEQHNDVCWMAAGSGRRADSEGPAGPDLAAEPNTNWNNGFCWYIGSCSFLISREEMWLKWYRRGLVIQQLCGVALCLIRFECHNKSCCRWGGGGGCRRETHLK